jgi:hypothetical protein
MSLNQNVRYVGKATAGSCVRCGKKAGCGLYDVGGRVVHAFCEDHANDARNLKIKLLRWFASKGHDVDPNVDNAHS